MSLLTEVISKDQDLIGSGKYLHGAVNNSLVVDTEKDIFFWNSKGIVGDVYVYLEKVKGLSYLDAKNYLKGFQSYEGSFIHTIKDSKEVVVYPKLVDVFYENGLQNNTSYWQDRGFTFETLNRFKLGYDGNGSFTIPIYQDGLFKNFQLRTDFPTKSIRPYYKGVGALLFNSDIMKLTNEIFITEGPTDCIMLSQQGLPSVSSTVGAGGWKHEWFKYFINQKKINVVYDNDDAGLKGAINVAKRLGLYRTKIYLFDGFDEGYDIIKYFKDGNTREKLLELLETSKYAFQYKEFE